LSYNSGNRKKRNSIATFEFHSKRTSSFAHMTKKNVSLIDNYLNLI